jgi:2-oxoglutarate dehydrogenase E2 component (dihydrolipoamide succinyltransferase)
MLVDLVVPTIGESIKTAFIARWRCKVGDPIEAGATILDLDSDKASLEVPSPASGRVVELLAAAGDEVDIGAVIARIDDAVAVAAAGVHGSADPAPAERGAQTGPAARQAAAEAGVAIDSVIGTGRSGRVLSRDVHLQAAAAPGATGAPAPVAVAPIDQSARVERVALSPLRRTIARRLVEAQQTAAMLTTFNEVDMSAVMALRARYQDSFVKRYGVKLGFMSFFTKAVIEALKAYPAVNAELDGDTLIYKHYYNLGVAVSTERGLVVPVLRDADRLSFAETERAINDLGVRARDGKLALADFQDGTFTISNGGVFGSLMSTPILNMPQVGILGMHTIQKRPVERDDQVVIRPMMYLALSYDHRVIDGAGAVGFLVRVKELIEAPERVLLEV